MSLSQRIRSMPRNPRFAAFLVHLGISLLLISAVFSVIYLVWFPHALSTASGGLQGLTIVASVDVVLGPLLTLIVYDIAKSKSHLARDIGIIAFLQLSCLLAGVYVVHQARPIAIVHVHDTFYVLRQTDFAELKIDPSVLDKFPGDYPKVLYVETEDSPVAFLAKKVLNELNHSLPPYLRTDLYREMPHDGAQVAAILHGKKTSNPSGCTVQNISSAYTSGTICFLPVSSLFTDFVAGLSISLLDDIKMRYETGSKPK